jgi:TPP-dependent pyruvate/acetoin dehydrogenase alpha subunit
MSLGKGQLHGLLFHLILTRKLQESLARLHCAKRLSFAAGLRSGLEAVSVGAAFALSQTDVLASSIPTIGALLVRGVTPVEVVLEFLGTGAQPTGGRNDIAHFGDLGRGIVATTGHVASHVSVMAGMAFSARAQGQDKVAVALVPEEAVGTGDFHEGLNFACVRKAPFVVIVVRAPDHRPGTKDGAQLCDRARGYGLTSVPVDGGELLEVIRVVERAVERARGDEGPTLVAASLRSSTPFSGTRQDPTRSESETDVGANPIQRFESFLSQEGFLSDSERAAIVARADAAVSDALRSADPSMTTIS